MVRVYGCSDDLVEFEGDEKYDEIGCYDEPVIVQFKDGTEAKVKYGKVINGHKTGIWEIGYEKKGSADSHIDPCTDDSYDMYSDILTIDSSVKSVRTQSGRELEQ